MAKPHDSARVQPSPSGVFTMANPCPTLNMRPDYDAFLYAPLADESGVMRLSVLSALARMDVDPWEEAARLATLSTSDAERSVVSVLNHFPGHPQSSSQTGALAARLVALLPKAPTATDAKVATITEDHAKRMSYWLVLLFFGIVMSILSPHQRTTTTSTGTSNSASASNAAHESNSNSAEDVPSAKDRAGSGDPDPPGFPSAESMPR